MSSATIEMHLAPMRSRSVLLENRGDVEEIAPIVDLRAAGGGDRHALALVIELSMPKSLATKRYSTG